MLQASAANKNHGRPRLGLSQKHHLLESNQNSKNSHSRDPPVNVKTRSKGCDPKSPLSCFADQEAYTLDDNEFDMNFEDINNSADQDSAVLMERNSSNTTNNYFKDPTKVHEARDAEPSFSAEEPDENDARQSNLKQSPHQHEPPVFKANLPTRIPRKQQPPTIAAIAAASATSVGDSSESKTSGKKKHMDLNNGIVLTAPSPVTLDRVVLQSVNNHIDNSIGKAPLMPENTEGVERTLSQSLEGRKWPPSTAADDGPANINKDDKTKMIAFTKVRKLLGKMKQHSKKTSANAIRGSGSQEEDRVSNASSSGNDSHRSKKKTAKKLWKASRTFKQHHQKQQQQQQQQNNSNPNNDKSKRRNNKPPPPLPSARPAATNAANKKTSSYLSNQNDHDEQLNLAAGLLLEAAESMTDNPQTINEDVLTGIIASSEAGSNLHSSIDKLLTIQAKNSGIVVDDDNDDDDDASHSSSIMSRSLKSLTASEKKVTTEFYQTLLSRAMKLKKNKDSSASFFSKMHNTSTGKSTQNAGNDADSNTPVLSKDEITQMSNAAGLKGESEKKVNTEQPSVQLSKKDSLLEKLWEKWEPWQKERRDPPSSVSPRAPGGGEQSHLDPPNTATSPIVSVGIVSPENKGITDVASLDGEIAAFSEAGSNILLVASTLESLEQKKSMKSIGTSPRSTKKPIRGVNTEDYDLPMTPIAVEDADIMAERLREMGIIPSSPKKDDQAHPDVVLKDPPKKEAPSSLRQKLKQKAEYVANKHHQTHHGRTNDSGFPIEEIDAWNKKESVSDLDNSIRNFPMTNIAAGGTIATVSELGGVALEYEGENAVEEAEDKFDENQLVFHRETKKDDNENEAALADSITEWSIHEVESDDTGAVAVEVMLSACNQTKLGHMCFTHLPNSVQQRLLPSEKKEHVKTVFKRFDHQGQKIRIKRPTESILKQVHKTVEETPRMSNAGYGQFNRGISNVNEWEMGPRKKSYDLATEQTTQESDGVKAAPDTNNNDLEFDLGDMAKTLSNANEKSVVEEVVSTKNVNYSTSNSKDVLAEATAQDVIDLTYGLRDGEEKSDAKKLLVEARRLIMKSQIAKTNKMDLLDTLANFGIERLSLSPSTKEELVRGLSNIRDDSIPDLIDLTGFADSFSVNRAENAANQVAARQPTLEFANLELTEDPAKSQDSLETLMDLAAQLLRMKSETADNKLTIHSGNDRSLVVAQSNDRTTTNKVEETGMSEQCMAHEHHMLASTAISMLLDQVMKKTGSDVLDTVCGAAERLTCGPSGGRPLRRLQSNHCETDPKELPTPPLTSTLIANDKGDGSIPTQNIMQRSIPTVIVNPTPILDPLNLLDDTKISEYPGKNANNEATYLKTIDSVITSNRELINPSMLDNVQGLSEEIITNVGTPVSLIESMKNEDSELLDTYAKSRPNSQPLLLSKKERRQEGAVTARAPIADKTPLAASVPTHAGHKPSLIESMKNEDSELLNTYAQSRPSSQPLLLSKKERRQEGAAAARAPIANKTPLAASVSTHAGRKPPLPGDMNGLFQSRRTPSPSKSAKPSKEHRPKPSPEAFLHRLKQIANLAKSHKETSNIQESKCISAGMNSKHKTEVVAAIRASAKRERSGLEPDGITEIERNRLLLVENDDSVDCNHNLQKPLPAKGDQKIEQPPLRQIESNEEGYTGIEHPKRETQSSDVVNLMKKNDHNLDAVRSDPEETQGYVFNHEKHLERNNKSNKNAMGIGGAKADGVKNSDEKIDGKPVFVSSDPDGLQGSILYHGQSLRNSSDKKQDCIENAVLDQDESPSKNSSYKTCIVSASENGCIEIQRAVSKHVLDKSDTSISADASGDFYSESAGKPKIVQQSDRSREIISDNDLHSSIQNQAGTTGSLQTNFTGEYGERFQHLFNPDSGSNTDLPTLESKESARPEKKASSRSIDSQPLVSDQTSASADISCHSIEQVTERPIQKVLSYDTESMPENTNMIRFKNKLRKTEHSFLGQNQSKGDNFNPSQSIGEANADNLNTFCVRRYSYEQDRPHGTIIDYDAKGCVDQMESLSENSSSKVCDVIALDNDCIEVQRAVSKDVLDKSGSSVSDDSSDAFHSEPDSKEILVPPSDGSKETISDDDLQSSIEHKADTSGSVQTNSTGEYGEQFQQMFNSDAHSRAQAVFQETESVIRSIENTNQLMADTLVLQKTSTVYHDPQRKMTFDQSEGSIIAESRFDASSGSFASQQLVSHVKTCNSQASVTTFEGNAPKQHADASIHSAFQETESVVSEVMEAVQLQQSQLALQKPEEESESLQQKSTPLLPDHDLQEKELLDELEAVASKSDEENSNEYTTGLAVYASSGSFGSQPLVSHLSGISKQQSSLQTFGVEETRTNDSSILLCPAIGVTASSEGIQSESMDNYQSVSAQNILTSSTMISQVHGAYSYDFRKNSLLESKDTVRNSMLEHQDTFDFRKNSLLESKDTFDLKQNSILESKDTYDPENLRKNSMLTTKSEARSTVLNIPSDVDEDGEDPNETLQAPSAITGKTEQGQEHVAPQVDSLGATESVPVLTGNKNNSSETHNGAIYKIIHPNNHQRVRSSVRSCPDTGGSLAGATVDEIEHTSAPTEVFGGGFGCIDQSTIASDDVSSLAKLRPSPSTGEEAIPQNKSSSFELPVDSANNCEDSFAQNGSPISATMQSLVVPETNNSQSSPKVGQWPSPITGKEALLQNKFSISELPIDSANHSEDSIAHNDSPISAATQSLVKKETIKSQSMDSANHSEDSIAHNDSPISATTQSLVIPETNKSSSMTGLFAQELDQSKSIGSPNEKDSFSLARSENASNSNSSSGPKIGQRPSPNTGEEAFLQNKFSISELPIASANHSEDSIAQNDSPISAATQSLVKPETIKSQSMDSANHSEDSIAHNDSPISATTQSLVIPETNKSSSMTGLFAQELDHSKSVGSSNEKDSFSLARSENASNSNSSSGPKIGQRPSPSTGEEAFPQNKFSISELSIVSANHSEDSIAHNDSPISAATQSLVKKETIKSQSMDSANHSEDSIAHNDSPISEATQSLVKPETSKSQSMDSANYSEDSIANNDSPISATTQSLVKPKTNKSLSMTGLFAQELDHSKMVGNSNEKDFFSLARSENGSNSNSSSGPKIGQRPSPSTGEEEFPQSKFSATENSSPPIKLSISVKENRSSYEDFDSKSKCFDALVEEIKQNKSSQNSLTAIRLQDPYSLLQEDNKTNDSPVCFVKADFDIPTGNFNKIIHSNSHQSVQACPGHGGSLAAANIDEIEQPSAPTEVFGGGFGYIDQPTIASDDVSSLAKLRPSPSTGEEAFLQNKFSNHELPVDSANHCEDSIAHNGSPISATIQSLIITETNNSQSMTGLLLQELDHSKSVCSLSSRQEDYQTDDNTSKSVKANATMKIKRLVANDDTKDDDAGKASPILANTEWLDLGNEEGMEVYLKSDLKDDQNLALRANGNTNRNNPIIPASANAIVSSYLGGHSQVQIKNIMVNDIDVATASTIGVAATSTAGKTVFQGFCSTSSGTCLGTGTYIELMAIRQNEPFKELPARLEEYKNEPMAIMENEPFKELPARLEEYENDREKELIKLQEMRLKTVVSDTSLSNCLSLKTASDSKDNYDENLLSLAQTGSDPLQNWSFPKSGSNLSQKEVLPGSIGESFSPNECKDNEVDDTKHYFPLRPLVSRTSTSAISDKGRIYQRGAESSPPSIASDDCDSTLPTRKDDPYLSSDGTFNIDVTDQKMGPHQHDATDEVVLAAPQGAIFSFDGERAKQDPPEDGKYENVQLSSSQSSEDSHRLLLAITRSEHDGYEIEPLVSASEYNGGSENESTSNSNSSTYHAKEEQNNCELRTRQPNENEGTSTNSTSSTHHAKEEQTNNELRTRQLVDTGSSNRSNTAETSICKLMTSFNEVECKHEEIMKRRSFRLADAGEKLVRSADKGEKPVVSDKESTVDENLSKTLEEENKSQSTRDSTDNKDNANKGQSYVTTEQGPSMIAMAANQSLSISTKELITLYTKSASPHSSEEESTEIVPAHALKTLFHDNVDAFTTIESGAIRSFLLDEASQDLPINPSIVPAPTHDLESNTPSHFLSDAFGGGAPDSNRSVKPDSAHSHKVNVPSPGTVNSPLVILTDTDYDGTAEDETISNNEYDAERSARNHSASGCGYDDTSVQILRSSCEANAGAGSFASEQLQYHNKYECSSADPATEMHDFAATEACHLVDDHDLLSAHDDSTKTNSTQSKDDESVAKKYEATIHDLASFNTRESLGKSRDFVDQIIQDKEIQRFASAAADSDDDSDQRALSLCYSPNDEDEQEPGSAQVVDAEVSQDIIHIPSDEDQEIIYIHSEEEQAAMRASFQCRRINVDLSSSNEEYETDSGDGLVSDTETSSDNDTLAISELISQFDDVTLTNENGRLQVAVLSDDASLATNSDFLKAIQDIRRQRSMHSQVPRTIGRFGSSAQRPIATEDNSNSAVENDEDKSTKYLHTTASSFSYSDMPARSRMRIPNDGIFENQESSSASVASHASQKARELRAQLDQALKTSAAIRSTQQRLGAELCSFKQRLDKQRHWSYSSASPASSQGDGASWSAAPPAEDRGFIMEGSSETSSDFLSSTRSGPVSMRREQHPESTQNDHHYSKPTIQQHFPHRSARTDRADHHEFAANPSSTNTTTTGGCGNMYYGSSALTIGASTINSPQSSSYYHEHGGEISGGGASHIAAASFNKNIGCNNSSSNSSSSARNNKNDESAEEIVFFGNKEQQQHHHQQQDEVHEHHGVDQVRNLGRECYDRVGDVEDDDDDNESGDGDVIDFVGNQQDSSTYYYDNSYVYSLSEDTDGDGDGEDNENNQGYYYDDNNNDEQRQEEYGRKKLNTK